MLELDGLITFPLEKQNLSQKPKKQTSPKTVLVTGELLWWSDCISEQREGNYCHLPELVEGLRHDPTPHP